MYLRSYHFLVPGVAIILILCSSLICATAKPPYKDCSCFAPTHAKDLSCNLSMSTPDVPQCSFRINKNVTKVTCAGGINVFGIDPEAAQNGEHAIKLSCNASYPIDINYKGLLPQTSLEIDYGRLANGHHRFSLNAKLLETEKSINGVYEIYAVTNSNLSTAFQLSLIKEKEDVSLNEVSTELTLKPANDSASGPFILCNSNLGSHIQRLTIISTNNPTESKLQENCLYGNHRCYNKREGSLGPCARFTDPHGVSFPSHTCVYSWASYPGGMAVCFLEGNQTTIIKKEYIIGLDNVLYFKEDYPDGFLSMKHSSVIRIDNYTRNAISGMPYNFSCVATKYFLSDSLSWFLRTKTGEVILEAQVTKKQDLLSHDERERTKEKKIRNTRTFHFTTDVKEVICVAYLWNSSQVQFNSTISINVVEHEKPFFNRTLDYPEFNLSTDDNKLTCLAYGIPPPKIEWIPIRNNISNETQDVETGPNHSKSFLWFHQGSPISILSDQEVHCRASNAFGNATKTFLIKIKAPPANIFGLVIGIPVAMCVSTLIVAIIIFVYYRTKPVGLSKYEIEQFKKGNPHPSNMGYANALPESIPYKQECEIDEDELHIGKCTIKKLDTTTMINDNEKNLLGEGAFGLVYFGKYQNKPVAVKTCKPNATKMELKSLLSELKLMMFMGEHENISKLMGAVTKHLEYGKVSVVIEYYPLGSLEGYLRKYRGTFVENKMYMNMGANTSGYQNLDMFGATKIQMEDLISWSYQIATGMEYLSNINVIHGDLATRNVLLDSNRQAKIADFGLSRKLLQYTNYVKKSQEPLPWKWLSIESLRDLTFSSASDVWSYGVTCWEIFSLGQVPFSGLNWSTNFTQQLCDGLRMHKPHLCPDAIYFLMTQCWRIDPDDRPSFTVLKTKFFQFLRDLNPSPVKIDVRVDI